MAVLNVTPDSFFDGGRHEGDLSKARIDAILDEGAFVIDVGAESTRPGAAPVATSVQLERLRPAVSYAVKTQRCWVSVDTADPAVADAVLGWGAHVINDVSCLADPELAKVTARHGAALVLMHSRGPMQAMAGFSQYPDSGYGDVVRDVMTEWCTVRDRAVACGQARDDILFDPGVGFAKNALQSMALLERLDEFGSLEAPIVFGPSRKSFLSLVEECPPSERLGATVAACLFASERGASLVRVHDVRVVRQALAAMRYFRRKGREDGAVTAPQPSARGGAC